jgi:biotin carboxylase
MILATPATEADASATRVLLLSTSHSYRDEPFIKAAAKLDIEVVVGIDMPRQLADYWGVQLGLDYSDPLKATAQIVSFAQERSLAAIIAVDDSGALLAARASEALGLPHNSTESAEAARDKYLMRTLLSRTDLLVPQFRRFSTDEDRNRVAREATFPCVVKPLRLSGSRGVIRANNGDELVAAINRLERILGKLTPGPHHYLVEQYIPGVEVALEGILDGSLKVMALFDKPDPLVGPYFEETIYVTPSRLSAEVQARIAEAAAKVVACARKRCASVLKLLWRN